MKYDQVGERWRRVGRWVDEYDDNNLEDVMER
jgi:hypothetical protein